MRVLVLSLPDLKKIYPQRPHQLLKHLSKKHEIRVLSVNAWWLKAKQDVYLDECLKNLEIVYPSKLEIHPMLQVLSMVKNSVKYQSSDQFDVLLSFHELFASYFISKRRKNPMVFDLCDDIVKYFASSSAMPWLLKPFAEVSLSNILQKDIKASKKITYSVENLKKIFNLSNDKSFLIPNGVDTKLFSPSLHVQEHFSSHRNEFVIGFVGALGNWVDLESTLLSLKKLREDNFKVKMLIVGGGELFSYLKNFVKQLNVADSVTFTGDVPYKEIPKYLSCMDVCLLPFKLNAISNSALPLKLFEYMACERPVISSKLPAIVDAVHDKVFYASNYVEFGDKLVTLLEDDDLRKVMGLEGRKFVAEKYSWKKIASNFERVLEGCLSE